MLLAAATTSLVWRLWMTLTSRAPTYTSVFRAFDRYAGDTKAGGLTLRPEKCTVLWPHSTSPPQPLIDATTSRGLRLVQGSMVCLGSIVGLDSNGMSKWALAHISDTTHLQLFSTLLNHNLP